VRIISLWQPWASLVVWGEKTIETRSWWTSYRGSLAIHASLRTPKETVLGLCGDFGDSGLVFQRAMRRHGFDLTEESIAAMPHGAVVGVANLVDVMPTAEASRMKLSTADRVMGNFTAGRFGWYLTEPVAFDDPIAGVTGGQGLRKVDEELFAQILFRNRHTKA
jgi:hypothetical protein